MSAAMQETQAPANLPVTTNGAKERNLPKVIGENGLVFADMEQMWIFATRVKASNLCPKDCKTVEDVFVRLQMGFEIGLRAMQSLNNIATINGRPTLWGDLSLALCKARKEAFEYATVDYENDPGDVSNLKDYTDNFAVVVRVKRKGEAEHVERFSVADAKLAGIWGANVWAKYPRRMIRHRAMTYALRSVFPDILGGIYSEDEAREMVEVQNLADQTPPKNLTDLTKTLGYAQAQQAKEPVEAEPVVDPDTGEILNSDDSVYVDRTAEFETAPDETPQASPEQTGIW
ncbi:MAG: hypothetical protein AMXMBFR84_37530 [Candidatus Hydrogenedentota bacterium]